MELTLDSYVNVHSRSVGRRTLTVETRDIVDVADEQSWWVDKPLIRVYFKSPPSEVFSRDGFDRALNRALSK